MTWREEQFLDVEEPSEITEDPFRCSWCKKPFDVSRMREVRGPEAALIESVMHLRADGHDLDEVLQLVQRVWEREEH